MLLNHLDKEEKGYVSVDEFVSGLQSMRASANVVSSTPPFLSHRKTQDMVFYCYIVSVIYIFQTEGKCAIQQHS